MTAPAKQAAPRERREPEEKPQPRKRLKLGIEAIVILDILEAELRDWSRYATKKPLPNLPGSMQEFVHFGVNAAVHALKAAKRKSVEALCKMKAKARAEASRG